MIAKVSPGQAQAQTRARPSPTSVALIKPSLSLAQAKAKALVPGLGPRASPTQLLAQLCLLRLKPELGS